VILGFFYPAKFRKACDLVSALKIIKNKKNCPKGQFPKSL
jgi:hypothetical protein